MHVINESPEQTAVRLERVVASASLEVLPVTYAFEEFSATEELHSRRFPEAVAFVKDGTTWCALVPSDDPQKELLRIFSFHFPDGVDNSGFIGWLASRIKERTGSGVIVICGHNVDRGGIYDYYGCPVTVGDEVVSIVKELMAIEEE